MGNDILTHIEAKHIINEGDCIELWKYFRERGDSDKQNMISTATWLLGFAVALLAYIVKTFTLNSTAAEITNEFLIYLGTGIIVCIYALVLVCQFGRHTRKQWYRAELLLKKIDKLEDILKLNTNERYDPEDGLAPIYWRYIKIVVTVLAAYILVFLIYLIF